MFSWKEDFFPRDSKLKIFYRTCLPEKIRGHVLVIHGYAEHSGRYRHVMEYLADRGYASYAPDHRGYGRTARCLADMESFEKIVDDLAAFRKHLESAYVGSADGARPLFVLGHSLGGCLALCLSALHPQGIAGTVASGSAIVIPDYVSPFLLAVIGLLAAFFPRLPVQPFKFEDVCRDPQVIEALRRDPLYYKGKLRARTGYQTLKGIKLARSVLGKLTLPLLILHGGDDRIMPSQGSRYILETVASPDKTLKIFDNLYHEIMNEPEKGKVLSTIGEWLDKHAG